MSRTKVVGALVLFCLSVFVSSCAAVSPFPNCPTEHVFDYLSCAEPDFSWYGYDETVADDNEELQELSEFVTLYCEEDATEWLSLLDSSVKESVPMMQEYLKGRTEFTFEDQEEFKSMQERDLFHVVLGIYLLRPMTIGLNNSIANMECDRAIPKTCASPVVESCVWLFEHFRDGGLIEFVDW